jgi:hypothetical protein
MSVSIFASAVRPKIWKSCLDSFQGTSCDFEVVFSGHNTEEEVAPFLKKYSFFKYIHTARTKPAQNYQVSLNHCTKETVVWFCDDAECNDDVIGKAYRYWKSQENEKLILSLQTKESGFGQKECALCDMNIHRFFGGRRSTPLMAPIAMMSRQFMNDLGGFDRRFVAGQYENLAVVMAMLAGGKVEIFGDKDCAVEIDHLRKSIDIGESTDMHSFLKRPFATGYAHDRKILESIVSIRHDGTPVMQLPFEPYEDTDLTSKSQSHRGQWE